MGRAVLMSVLWMTTLFASILISLDRNLSSFPNVLVRNQLMKEAENASDFALRNAIRNAGSSEFLDSYLHGQNFADEISFVQSFNNFKIGNCTIDSLRYSYSNSQAHYKVKSYIRSSLQGVNVSRDAEMAFNYPFLTLGSSKPNVLYLEMERLLLFPWLFTNNNLLPDSSGNDYTGIANGFSLISATIPWGGAFSRYCTKFNGIDNYLSVAPQPDASGVDSLNTDDSFSLLMFAKIDKNGRQWYSSYQGTLIWIPSEPSSTTLRYKPSAGIWFSTSDGSMHFAVTQNNTSKTMLEAVVAHTRTAVIFYWFFGVPIFNSSFTDYPWCSYGLTYNQGVLKAYINGQLVQTVTGANVRAYPSLYGMSIGRKDIRGSGVLASDYKYFCGVMDQAGMHDRALNGAEMYSWHKGVMSSTMIKYIRD